MQYLLPPLVIISLLFINIWTKLFKIWIRLCHFPAQDLSMISGSLRLESSLYLGLRDLSLSLFSAPSCQLLMSPIFILILVHLVAAIVACLMQVNDNNMLLRGFVLTAFFSLRYFHDSLSHFILISVQMSPEQRSPYQSSSI